MTLDQNQVWCTKGSLLTHCHLGGPWPRHVLVGEEKGPIRLHDTTQVRPARLPTAGLAVKFAGL